MISLINTLQDFTHNLNLSLLMQCICEVPQPLTYNVNSQRDPSISFTSYINKTSIDNYMNIKIRPSSYSQQDQLCI